jgi:hypothetical protein
MKTKSEARYTDKSPHEGKTCGNCHMFRKPQRCTLVSGVIRAPGWCKYWERKGPAVRKGASSLRQAASPFDSIDVEYTHEDNAL